MTRATALNAACSECRSRPDLGGSEQGGLAGAVGYFEGEGNQGSVAPLDGAIEKSAADGEANSQGSATSRDQTGSRRDDTGAGKGRL